MDLFASLSSAFLSLKAQSHSQFSFDLVNHIYVISIYIDVKLAMFL